MDILPIVNKTYELYKVLIVTNNRISKRMRYSLGVPTENNVLEFLDLVIMAKNAPKPFKAGYLLKADSLLEILVLKLRLFLELKLVNETRIFKMQADLEEIGRMLGGWLKFVKST